MKIEDTLTTNDLLVGHLRHYSMLGTVKQLLTVDSSKKIQHPSHNSRPARLMASPKPCAIVPMKVFVEKDVILPVGIFLELLGSAINRPIASFIAQEDA